MDPDQTFEGFDIWAYYGMVLLIVAVVMSVFVLSLAEAHRTNR